MHIYTVETVQNEKGENEKREYLYYNGQLIYEGASGTLITIFKNLESISSNNSWREQYYEEADDPESAYEIISEIENSIIDHDSAQRQASTSGTMDFSQLHTILDLDDPLYNWLQKNDFTQSLETFSTYYRNVLGLSNDLLHYETAKPEGINFVKGMVYYNHSFHLALNDYYLEKENWHSPAADIMLPELVGAFQKKYWKFANEIRENISKDSDNRTIQIYTEQDTETASGLKYIFFNSTHNSFRQKHREDENTYKETINTIYSAMRADEISEKMLRIFAWGVDMYMEPERLLPYHLLFQNNYEATYRNHLFLSKDRYDYISIHNVYTNDTLGLLSLAHEGEQADSYMGAIINEADQRIESAIKQKTDDQMKVDQNTYQEFKKKLYKVIESHCKCNPDAYQGYKEYIDEMHHFIESMLPTLPEPKDKPNNAYWKIHPTELSKEQEERNRLAGIITARCLLICDTQNPAPVYEAYPTEHFANFLADLSEHMNFAGSWPLYFNKDVYQSALYAELRDILKTAYATWHGANNNLFYCFDNMAGLYQILYDSCVAQKITKLEQCPQCRKYFIPPQYVKQYQAKQERERFCPTCSEFSNHFVRKSNIYRRLIHEREINYLPDKLIDKNDMIVNLPLFVSRCYARFYFQRNRDTIKGIWSEEEQEKLKTENDMAVKKALGDEINRYFRGCTKNGDNKKEVQFPYLSKKRDSIEYKSEPDCELLINMIEEYLPENQDYNKKVKQNDTDITYAYKLKEAFQKKDKDWKKVIRNYSPNDSSKSKTTDDKDR